MAQHARPTHAEGEESIGRLTAWSVGVAAATLGVIVLVLLLLDSSHTPVRAHRVADAPDAAGLQPAEVSTSAAASGSSAGSTRPTRPSGSTSTAAPTSATPTGPHATSAAQRRSQSTVAEVVHRSVVASSTSRSTAVAPRATTVQRVITITLVHHAVTGTVSVTMPSGWVITGVQAAPGGRALRTSGDGVHEATWQLIGSSMSVTVSGSSDTTGTMTVHTNSLGGSSNTTYQLP